MKLPQLETPKPKQKMRTFNWNKLPVNKILGGKTNIWSLVAKKNEAKSAAGSKSNKKAKQPINFEDMEHLFCQQQAQPQSSNQSGGAARDKDDVDKAKKKDEVRSPTQRAINF